MARRLSTFVDFDVSDADVTFVKGGTSMKSKPESDQISQLVQSLDAISCKSLRNTIACFCPVKEYELSEPESELDPLQIDPLEVTTHALANDSASVQFTQPVHSTKGRKKRHASLIDKAWKAQQKQQPDDVLAPNEPLYIRLSDLAGNWSDYTRVVTRSTFAPVLVDVHEASVSTKTKRNRKKSLIDKAASQQRRLKVDMHLANLTIF